ncbi:hypothetical protein Ac2012v2_006894 [Leucoagaricus gongylophorus]
MSVQSLFVSVTRPQLSQISAQIHLYLGEFGLAPSQLPTISSINCRVEHVGVNHILGRLANGVTRLLPISIGLSTMNMYYLRRLLYILSLFRSMLPHSNRRVSNNLSVHEQIDLLESMRLWRTRNIRMS